MPKNNWAGIFMLRGFFMAKKVLLVEDHDHCREAFARFIKHLGYEVVEAATGSEAVHLASTEHPDLIVTDLDMPGMAGDEATAHIKANPTTRDIPVIINTGWVVGDRRRHILELGAAEILHKPFSLNTMQDLLHKYLRGYSETAGTEAA